MAKSKKSSPQGRVRLDRPAAYAEVRDLVNGGTPLSEAYKQVAERHGVSASTVAGAVVARRRRDPDWPLRERRQPGTRGFDHEKAYIAVRKRVAKGERVMPACAAVAAETGATKGAVWQVVLASREGDPQWPTDKVRMGAPATFDHDKAAKKVAQRMAKGESVTAACRAVGDEMGVKPASVYNAVRKQRAAA